MRCLSDEGNERVEGLHGDVAVSTLDTKVSDPQIESKLRRIFLSVFCMFFFSLGTKDMHLSP